MLSRKQEVEIDPIYKQFTVSINELIFFIKRHGDSNLNKNQNHLYIHCRDTKTETAQKWEKKTNVDYHHWTDGRLKALIRKECNSTY